MKNTERTNGAPRRAVRAGRSQPRGFAALFDGEIAPIRELERRYAAWALDQMAGNKTRTAERLGVDVKTLAKWLSEESKTST